MVSKVVKKLLDFSKRLERPFEDISERESGCSKMFCYDPGDLTNILLDFKSRHANRVHLEAEGKLREKILHGMHGDTVSVLGSVSETGGVYGMGGVGETIALQALC